MHKRPTTRDRRPPALILDPRLIARTVSTECGLRLTVPDTRLQIPPVRRLKAPCGPYAAHIPRPHTPRDLALEQCCVDPPSSYGRPSDDVLYHIIYLGPNDFAFSLPKNLRD
ncbi:hypothetical protein NMY22_g11053 [Coprinellus aureogranulatus]|nr:hypothetical protein NMY22_g11053 [Coprinellus aureogranulatus]